VNRWIESLRSIPYSFSQQWRTPSEVEAATTADCKGKAVTLYEKMRRSGISNVRLVIGRRSPSSRSTHAWVEWAASDANYILDPTINWFAFRSDDIPSDSYIPFYAYSGSHKFCATPEVLVARN
jgi:predicted transglutaminase-like cysteine proteinase